MEVTDINRKLGYRCELYANTGQWHCWWPPPDTSWTLVLPPPAQPLSPANNHKYLMILPQPPQWAVCLICLCLLSFYLYLLDTFIMYKSRKQLDIVQKEGFDQKFRRHPLLLLWPLEKSTGKVWNRIKHETWFIKSWLLPEQQWWMLQNRWWADSRGGTLVLIISVILTNNNNNNNNTHLKEPPTLQCVAVTQAQYWGQCCH